LIIGVTGSIGAGKTTFSKFLNNAIRTLTNENILLIDADEVAKNLISNSMQKIDKEKHDSNSIAVKLIETFGAEIRMPNGTLNRTELAKRAFDTDVSAQALNKIVHPAVIEKILSMTSDTGFYILDVPLLFESGLNKECDKTITVTSEDFLRKERSGRFKDFDTRDSRQWRSEKKSMLSDYVAVNNGSLKELEILAVEIAKKIVK